MCLIIKWGLCMQEKERFSNFKQHVSRFMTKRNQRLIFLFTFFVVIASIYTAATGAFPEPVSITLYALAAIGFTCTCTLWVKAIIFFVKMILLPFTKRDRIANTLITDTRLRTVLFTVPGMGINLIYAIFNGVIGILNRSAWCGSLAAYYILLSVMRFLSVSYARKLYDGRFLLGKEPAARDNNEENSSLQARSRKVYKNCGIMLSASSIALGGTVIMLVYGEGRKTYPGIMIYAVATYTFYKLTMSIINMVKSRKEDSLLLVTLRNINYTDSLVSILSLQTALFATFGQGSEDIIPIFSALTGTGVCLMIFALGIHMVSRAKKMNRENKA